MSIEDHQRTFSLQISYKCRYAQMGRYTHQHLDVIRTCLCLYYLYAFHFAQLSQYFPYVRFDSSIDFLSTILRCKHDMIFTMPFCMWLTYIVICHNWQTSFAFVSVARPELIIAKEVSCILSFSIHTSSAGGYFALKLTTKAFSESIFREGF